jgi:YHS domain-containing protein
MSTCIVAARRLMGLVLLVFVSTLGAEPGVEKPDHQELNIAIQGYSPVSYFSRNVAEKGSPEFAVEYDGKTYLLTSQQQIEAFRENPEAYIPLFSPFCPYSLALGRQVGIDPTNFKIVDGKLLLFHNEGELDGLKQWNDHGNEQELLDRANQEYLRLKF